MDNGVSPEPEDVQDKELRHDNLNNVVLKARPKYVLNSL